ncbi:MAG: hypothetical protein Q7S40_04090 [Opitutaceae bacterium]|nr:hypothetical protein [Opitutaceae bacterium]
MAAPDTDPAARRTRQRKTITILGVALIVIGLAVLLLLQRMPLPLRLMVGLGDVLAGAVLLVLARQILAPQKPKN